MRLRNFDDPFVLAVLNNPDDFDEGSGRAFGAEALTEGILIGPEFLGHGLVDDRDSERLLLVALGKRSPVTHGDVQGIKISGCNHVVLHAGRLLARLSRVTFNV